MQTKIVIEFKYVGYQDNLDIKENEMADQAAKNAVTDPSATIVQFTTKQDL